MNMLRGRDYLARRSSRQRRDNRKRVPGSKKQREQEARGEKREARSIGKCEKGPKKYRIAGSDKWDTRSREQETAGNKNQELVNGKRESGMDGLRG